MCVDGRRQRSVRVSARSDAATIAGYAERFDHRVVITDGPLEIDGVEVIGLDELAAISGELPPEPRTRPR